MRLRRLVLERYGHVSGEVMDFPAERGLHVVLGANEAGKSTALEALTDGLFGFSLKDSRKLRHPDDPRIGLTLVAADDTEASFVRRRTGRDKLFDASGAAVPEAALARFLGGLTRQRFRDVFGLDGDRLRQGGRTILSDHGDAGAALLQAQTGLRGLRDAVDRLDTEAKGLFGDGRGVRQISRAATQVRDNRKLVAERSLTPAAYDHALSRQAALSARLDAIQAESHALRAEQARLDRVRRTTPVRRALADAAARLAALGPPPDLPDGSAPRYADAVARRDQARRDHARDHAHDTALAKRLAALAPDPAILAEAALLRALGADRSRVEEARRDRLKVLAQADAERQALDGVAGRLGIPERGAALLPRLLPAAARRTADRLLRQHTERDGARQQAAATLGRAQQAAEAAAAALAANPSADDAAPLRTALEAADRAGALDAALDEAVAARATAAADLTTALAALPLWSGDADQLHAAPIPLDAEALRLGTALEAAAAGQAASTAALAAHDRELAQVRAAKDGIAQAGPLPTAAAIAEARARRDLAWRWLRRHVLEGGPAPTAADWPGLPPTASELPDLLDTLLRQADELVDRRASEAIRLGRWQDQVVAEAQLAAGRDALLAAQDAATAAHAAARSAWDSAWAPSGLRPLGPAAMRDWVHARTAALAAARAARETRAAHDRLAARHADLRTRLHAALGSPGPPETTLAALQAAATRRLRTLDDAASRHATARAGLARAREAEAAARHEADTLAAEAAHWATEWAPLAARLGLEPAAPAATALDVLDLWAEAQTRADRCAALDQRIREMAETLEADAAAQARLAGRLGVPGGDGLVPRLAARLATAEATETERRRLAAERTALAATIGAHERIAAAAEDSLAALHARAGTTDDAALAAALARAAEHATTAALIRARTAELHTLDDGKPEAALAEEAAALEPDAILARLPGIAARLTELDAERTETAAQRASADAERQRLEAGQDVAGPAQAVQDSLAEIEDAAQRYIRLRLAHALLRAGIEGFRRSQQGPLLQGASGLFAELTGSRYERLELDEEKGTAIIVALRPDGSTCTADMLSEGTRDQLFLALRLASIRLEAAATQPVPFIADDLLVNFDDARAAAALRLLARFGAETQVILFTHHRHLTELVDPALASIHLLPRELAPA